MSQTNRPSGSGTGWAIGSNLFAKNDVNFLFNNFLNNLLKLHFQKKINIQFFQQMAQIRMEPAAAVEEVNSI
jgi:hypothetical protein